LLSLCTEKRILDFTQHIDSLLSKGSIRKLGEASYSEVFLSSSGNDSTVLKIIPFNKSPDQVDQCAPSAIVQELRITLAMAPIKGYIVFHSCHVVRGSFPASLLQFWDEYDENHGSENERPDFYEDDQLFAIIGLENGGRDLEHTELRNWEEAEDVFWQVAKALARGEKEREFEHRDLHWGNVVIKRKMEEEVAPEEKPEELTLQGLTIEEAGIHREKPSNFEVALIDYTLSRAWCGDLPGGQEYEFMQLDDPALFTGKGDYQFDIYRFMQQHISDADIPPEEQFINWNIYAPKTNIFWLHYILNILLTKMGLSRPAARGRYAASEQEQEAYKRLEIIGKGIDPRKKRFAGKGNFGGLRIETAGELVQWAVEEELIWRGI
ncbi:hypothetical protein BZA77DRAFT_245542, partial [Pyronema omphalodes]